MTRPAIRPRVVPIAVPTYVLLDAHPYRSASRQPSSASATSSTVHQLHGRHRRARSRDPNPSPPRGRVLVSIGPVFACSTADRPSGVDMLRP